VTRKEYRQRQTDACFKLAKLGCLKFARMWIRKNRPPPDWKGVPMEYALLRMLFYR